MPNQNRFDTHFSIPIKHLPTHLILRVVAVIMMIALLIPLPVSRAKAESTPKLI